MCIDNDDYLLNTIDHQSIYFSKDIVLLKPRAHKIIVNEQAHCLAKCVYFEARNQSDKGKLAIIDVILSRVNDSRFPDSICDVVHEKNQFSWYWDNKSDDIPEIDSDLFFKIYDMAVLALRGDVRYSVTNNATHYYADYIDPPYWTKKMIRTAKIENHIFYR
jgi:spore germination cell wall hydrolase CwlJ-like protein